MASCSYYKVYGANRIGALVIRNECMDMISRHPLVNSTLLDLEGNHGGTLSLASAAASLNSLKLCLVNRENKEKRLEHMRAFLGDCIQETLSSALDNVTFTHFRPDTLKQVKKSRNLWHLVVFSHPGSALPTTFMFALIRNLGDRLDAPCGKKLVDYLSSKGFIVSTGSACGAHLAGD
jgi:cysteine sulfinate desulfinase/cysteine desulfurase-like protein